MDHKLIPKAEMNYRNEVCILKHCLFKRKGGLELKVKADGFIDKLEIKPTKFDNAKNIYICIKHLHPVIDGKKHLEHHWLKHQSLPDQFVIGKKGVPKTYRISKYRVLQERQKVCSAKDAKLALQDHDYVQV